MKKIFNSKALLICVLFALALIGVIYVRYVWQNGMAMISARALNIATIVEIGLNGEMFKLLRAVPEDVRTVAYESIKKRLEDIVAVEKGARFAYIYTQRDGKLYFMVDSEAADSKDYSPPGQEYTEAPEAYWKPFIDGQPLISTPQQDRWGTWISILVPMKDAKTGKVVAVFGFDYPAGEWGKDAYYSAIQSGIIFTGVILLILAAYVIFIIRLRTVRSEKKYAYLFKYSKDAIMTLAPPDWQFTDGNPATLEVFGMRDKKDLKVIRPQDASPKFQPDGKLSSKKVKEMIDMAMKNGSHSFEWVHKKVNGQEFMADVTLTRVNVGKDVFLQAVVRDITEQKRQAELLKKKTKETQKALAEAERFNKLMVGRELEMIKLKKELKNIRGR